MNNPFAWPPAALFLILALSLTGGCRERGQAETEPAAGPASQSTRYSDFKYAGNTRKYILVTPSSYRAGQPAPLLVFLHGGTGDARGGVERTGLVPVAEREGLLLLYPESSGEQWNDGRETTRNNVDDVGFIVALVDSVARERAVDRSRVYVAGISNGGMMTQRLACEKADVFAGFVSVIANMPAALAGSCRPSRPVSMLLINGKSDPLMPWNGGEIKKGRRSGAGGRVISAPETAAFWSRQAGCSMESAATLPDRDRTDGTRVVQTEYSACRPGAGVVWLAVEGGGHAWPGMTLGPVAKRIVGKSTADIDGAATVWAFLRDRRLDRP